MASGKDTGSGSHGFATSPAYVRVAAVALIGDKEGRWFLVRLPDDLVPSYTGHAAPPEGVWAPPGGRLEAGESLEDALVREMQEELGLCVETAGPCGAHLAVHKGEPLVAVTMACRVGDGSGPIEPRLDSTEAVDWRWVTTAEWLDLARLGLTPWRREDIVKTTTLAECLWRVVTEGGHRDER